MASDWHKTLRWFTELQSNKQNNTHIYYNVHEVHDCIVLQVLDNGMIIYFNLLDKVQFNMYTDLIMIKE